MTNKPPLPTDDARQRDELDAFLDDLAHGNQASPPSLDPTLAATVRHIHDLASEQIAAHTRRAAKAHRWEDLMRTNAVRSTLTPFPTTATLPRSSAPPPIPLRPAMPTFRLRRLGGQSLGLVATVTLVLLVAASSLALYLSAPQGDDDPTMLPAAFGATPSDTPSAGRQNPRVSIGVCDVTPMSFDDLMGVLAAPAENGTLPPDTSRLDLPLPDGTPVDQSTEETLTLLTGNYLGCATSLDIAAISTDDGIFRMLSLETYYPGRSDFHFLNGDLLVQAWQHRDDVRSSDLSFIGQPSPFVLTDMRQLADGRVAGYLSRSYSLDADGTLTASADGYIVFAQDDRQWLVDDFRPSLIG